MADLIFADSHNMVAYLEKSEDNADFAEIVNFLNASHIRSYFVFKSLAASHHFCIIAPTNTQTLLNSINPFLSLLASPSSSRVDNNPHLLFLLEVSYPT
ncbi:hypothetical protein Tco_1211898 [Tanacetum coccineum]